MYRVGTTREQGFNFFLDLVRCTDAALGFFREVTSMVRFGTRLVGLLLSFDMVPVGIS